MLYKREKFAFMAPPAHTDETKWQQMKSLSNRLLSDSAIRESGLLSTDGVKALFDQHDDPAIEGAQRVQMDAVINHLLCVQIMHNKFIKADVPSLAAQRAEELGWAA